MQSAHQSPPNTERLQQYAATILQPERKYQKAEIVTRIMQDTGGDTDRAKNGLKMLLDAGVIIRDGVTYALTQPQAPAATEQHQQNDTDNYQSWCKMIVTEANSIIASAKYRPTLPNAIAKAEKKYPYNPSFNYTHI